jgi:hypothetical protein
MFLSEVSVGEGEKYAKEQSHFPSYVGIPNRQSAKSKARTSYHVVTSHWEKCGVINIIHHIRHHDRVIPAASTQGIEILK